MEMDGVQAGKTMLEQTGAIRGEGKDITAGRMHPHGGFWWDGALHGIILRVLAATDARCFFF
jgi:hypothetical protein